MKKVDLENGNYALIYYYNDNNESVEENDATKCIIAEFDSEHKMIKESRFDLRKQDDFLEDDIPLVDNSAHPIF